MMKREIEVTTQTKEANIRLKFNIEGSGKFDISTNIAFFDHLLSALIKHSEFDMSLSAESLDNNKHHLVEAVASALAQGISKVLKDKKGISRFGYCVLPMDESLVLVSLDICGRSNFVLKEGNKSLTFYGILVEDVDLGLIEHFLATFANVGGINLHINIIYGKDMHHITEACFKALGISLTQATRYNPQRDVPSTKGVL